MRPPLEEWAEKSPSLDLRCAANYAQHLERVVDVLAHKLAEADILPCGAKWGEDACGRCGDGGIDRLIACVRDAVEAKVRER